MGLKHIVYRLFVLMIILMSNGVTVADPGNGNAYGHGNIHANADAPGQQPDFIPPGQNKTTDPEPLDVVIINTDSASTSISEDIQLSDQNTVPDQPTNEGIGMSNSESATSEEPSADLQLPDQDSVPDQPDEAGEKGAEDPAQVESVPPVEGEDIDNEHDGAGNNNNAGQTSDNDSSIVGSDGGITAS